MPSKPPIVQLEAPPRPRAPSPTWQEVERDARRSLEELHSLARRIFHRLEGLFEEEGELEPQTWPFVLRAFARSIEIRNRGAGGSGARHDGPQERPAPRFPKLPGPPDPSRRAIVYRCHLARHAQSHAVEW